MANTDLTEHIGVLLLQTRAGQNRDNWTYPVERAMCCCRSMCTGAGWLFTECFTHDRVAVGGVILGVSSVYAV